jgi:hypothetical protein
MEHANKYIKKKHIHTYIQRQSGMCVQHGPTDLISPNLGMSSSAETKRDTQVQDKEGGRKLALTQRRPCQQIYKLVPNVC